LLRLRRGFIPRSNPCEHNLFDIPVRRRCLGWRAVFTGYHYGMPGAGTIAKDGNGYTYVPVKA